LDALSKHINLNSEEAFREVFNSFYKPLVNYALTIVNNTNEAEDIVQELFVDVWNKTDEFNTIKKLKPYLYRSVRNRCLNFLRDASVKEKNISKLPDEDAFELPISHDIIKEEVYQQLQTVFNTLPTQCKKIYELSLSGMKASEIAEELSITVDTVKAHKKRAKKLMRERLGNLTYLLFILIG